MTNYSDVRRIMRARLIEYYGYKNRQIKIVRYKNQAIGNMFSVMPVVVMTVFVIAAGIIGLFYTAYRGQLTADSTGLEPVSLEYNLSRLSLDPDLPYAIKNTFIYTGVTTAGALFMSLILASTLNLSKIRGKKLFLIAFFLPQVTSEVATTIIFSAMLKFNFNVVENPQNWFWIIAIVGTWGVTSSSLVIFNTAFANIGKTEYEAASLDGAKTFTKFFKITLPSLAPIIAYQLVMMIVIGMTAFGTSYILISSAYVTGNDQRNIIMWPVLGFLRVRGGSGYATNVGLGMIELTILAITLVVLTVLSNFIQPIQGRRK